MSTPYTVTFTNNSSNSGSVCIFQQDPNMTNPDIMSLAWFTQFCYPNTTTSYQWSIDYSFIWGQTGVVTPGVLFVAGQSLPADLAASNEVTLTYNRAYNFINQTAGGQAGSLYITEDGSIPLDQAAVGIGMSGAGTFVQQAQPNLNLTFTPHPTYWIAFGNFTTGQVLNVQSMTSAQEILFPPGVNTMSAVLNQNNTWTIAPLADMNRAYVARNYPELLGRGGQQGETPWEGVRAAPAFRQGRSTPSWP